MSKPYEVWQLGHEGALASAATVDEAGTLAASMSAQGTRYVRVRYPGRALPHAAGVQRRRAGLVRRRCE